MSIITQQRLTERLTEPELIRLTDDAGEGALDTDNMQRAIDAGEAEILSRLGRRYTLPLSLSHATDQAVVTTYCLDVVVYHLFVRREAAAAGSDSVLAAAYKAAIAWAEKVAKGELDLLGEAEAEDAPVAGGGIVVHSSEAVISRTSMKGL